jgi:hypothetical protein
MSWFRKPDVTLTVKIIGKHEVAQVIENHRRFVDLCMKYKLDIVHVLGQAPNEITVRGRPKNISAFAGDFARLQIAGLV